jgi:hypothetical protein
MACTLGPDLTTCVVAENWTGRYRQRCIGLAAPGVPTNERQSAAVVAKQSLQIDGT